MADLILGYPTACMVLESPLHAGHVRVLYPPEGIDPILASRFTTSNHVANVSLATPAAARILATNAGKFQRDPVWFDLELAYSGTDWATGHRCAPQYGAAVTLYTTPAACNTGMASGDTVWVWNASVLGGHAVAESWVWNVSNWGTGKIVDLYGMLPRHRVNLCTTTGTRVYTPNSTGAPDREYRVENLTFTGIYAIAVNANIPSPCRMVLDRIACLGGSLFGRVNALAGSPFTVQNSFCYAPGYGAINPVDNGWFNTVVTAITDGITAASNNPDGFPRLQNNALYLSGLTNNAGVCDYCASYWSTYPQEYDGPVATAKGMLPLHMRINYPYGRYGFAGAADPGFVAARGSILDGTGTPIPGIDYDLRGNPRPTLVKSTEQTVSGVSGTGVGLRVRIASHGYRTGESAYFHQAGTGLTVDNGWQEICENLHGVRVIDTDWVELEGVPPDTVTGEAVPMTTLYAQRYAGRRPSIGCCEGVEAAADARFW